MYRYLSRESCLQFDSLLPLHIFAGSKPARGAAEDPAEATRLSDARRSIDAFAAVDGADDGSNASGARTLRLSPALTQADRAALHCTAESLGLGHVSIGEGKGQRALLLWKGVGWTPHGAAKAREARVQRKARRKPTNGLVGNPAAIIEIVSTTVVDPETGERTVTERVEASRGFVLPPSWSLAAAPLVSRTGG